MGWLLFGLIVGCVVGYLIASCIVSGKFDDMRTEIWRLKKENSSLREYVDDLENENIK